MLKKGKHQAHKQPVRLVLVTRKNAETNVQGIPCACTDGEYMIIKSDKGNIVFIIFSYILLSLIGGLFVSENNGLTSAVCMGLLVWIIGSIFCIRWYIAVFRKIAIGSSGVTISLFHKIKFYPWDSMSIYYESYQNQLGLRLQYKGTVILSPRRFKKPKHISPLMYCIVFHPYSFTFIYFYEESIMKDAPNVYPVKKQEFLSKMAALGIIDSNSFLSA